MKPYLGDVDASLINTFTCQINSEGGSIVNAYELFVKDLEGNAIYTKAKTTVSNLYNGDTLSVSVPANSFTNGNDYIWSVKLYEVNPTVWVVYGTIQSTTPSTTTNLYLRKHDNVSVGMTIKISGQTRTIATWNASTGLATVTALSAAPAAGTGYTIYSNYLTSPEVFFKARKTPTVTINSFTTPITTKSYTFVGTYTQNDNVSWKRFKWTLYNNDDSIAQETDWITTGVIQYTFDGLIDDKIYKIELTVENQDDVVISSNVSTFSINYAYPVPTLQIIPDVVTLINKNAFQIAWTQPFINTGVASSVSGGTSAPFYDYVVNEPYLGAKSIFIHNDAKIVYQPATSVESVDIPYESTVCINSKFTVGYTGEVIKLEDTASGAFYSVTYNDGSFYYNINNEIIGQVVIETATGRWLLSLNELYNDGYRYLWEDGDVWEDTYIYAEQKQDILASNWFKITLLPDKVLVKINDVGHLNVFYDPNTTMVYNTRLMSDEPLITTDVLYV